MASALSTHFKRGPHLLPPTILLDDQTHGNMLLNLVFLQLLIHHVVEYLVCAFLTFDFSRAPSVIIIIPSRVSSLKAFCVISKQLSVVPNPWLPSIASTTEFLSLSFPPSSGRHDAEIRQNQLTISMWNMFGRFVLSDAILGNVLAPPQSIP
jgi:hypothetical protein